MPGTHKQNSMFKKTKGYVQSGNPFPVSSCGRRRNLESPLHENKKKTPAWTRKEGKDPEGGLNEKGRKSYEKENPGSNLQESVKEDNPTGKRKTRKDQFCARMGGMKKKLTSKKTANDPNSRINKTLRDWKC